MLYREDLINELVDISKMFPDAIFYLDGEYEGMPISLTAVDENKDNLCAMSELYDVWIVSNFPNPEDRNEETSRFSSFLFVDVRPNLIIPHDVKIKGGEVYGNTI